MTRKEAVRNVIEMLRAKAELASTEGHIIDSLGYASRRWTEHADALESLIRDYESRGWMIDMEAK